MQNCCSMVTFSKIQILFVWTTENQGSVSCLFLRVKAYLNLRSKIWTNEVKHLKSTKMDAFVLVQLISNFIYFFYHFMWKLKIFFANLSLHMTM